MKRSQIVITDECVLIKKKDYEEIIEPTLTQRSFVGRPHDYIEEPKQIFLSSAKTKTNWMWRHLRNCVNGHYKDKVIKYGFFAVDIFSALASGIQTKNQYLQRKKNTDDMSFQQEYLNIFLGNNENSIFKFEDFEQNQILETAFYPRTAEEFMYNEEQKYVFSDDYVRILVCDIAVATGDENDNTVYLFMAINKETGQAKVECIIPKNGLNSVLQVLYMKRWFYEYKADYFMIDTKGVGNVIYDLLTVTTEDKEFNTTYPAWTACTDKLLQISSDKVINDKIIRTMEQEAEPIIIPYAGTAELNCQMHLTLRKSLRDKSISLLKDDAEMQSLFEDRDSSYILKSSEEKAKNIDPYVQTRITINEAISLEATLTETGLLKVQEAKRTDTKDRYMTLAMANMLADRIYNKYKKEDSGELSLEDFFDIYDN